MRGGFLPTFSATLSSPTFRAAHLNLPSATPKRRKLGVALKNLVVAEIL